MATFTAQQTDAINAPERVVLVKACPGAGKTTVLIGRVRKLVSKDQVPTDRILALMFNRSVRLQFMDRLARNVEGGSGIQVHTFHSFCYQTLCAENLIDVALSDEISFERACAAICTALQKQPICRSMTITPSLVSSTISRLNNGLYGLGDLQDPEMSVLAHEELIFRAYDEHKAKHSAVFQVDLLYLLAQALRLDPRLATRVNQSFEHILVDEAQDMNWAQINLVLALRNHENRFFFVFDTNQTIFGFLGAKPDFIEKSVKTYFKGVKTYKLDVTFRYGTAIAAISSKLMWNPARQIEPDLIVSARHNQSKVTVLSPAGKLSTGCLQYIESIVEERSGDLRAIALLVRNYSHGHAIALALSCQGIPYRLEGAEPFYKSQSFQRFCAVLRVVCCQSKFVDEQLFNNAVCFFAPFCPPHLIRSTLGDTLQACVDNHKNLSQFQIKKLKAAYDVLSIRMDGASKAFSVMRLIFETQGSWPQIDPNASESRCLDQLRELREFYWLCSKNLLSVDSCLELVNLFILNYDEYVLGENYITISTIHKAKGLEWPVVIIPELQQCGFPDPTCQSDEQIEEERRLLYVAMTRAIDEICLVIPPDGVICRALSLPCDAPPLPNSATSIFMRELNLARAIEMGKTIETNVQSFVAQDDFERAYLARYLDHKKGESR